jgi:YfiH family protein
MNPSGGPPAVPRIRSSQFGEPSLTIETTSGLTIFGRTTTRADGDFAVDAEPGALEARRRAVVDLPWFWLDQVHGGDVVSVTGPRDTDVRGRPADALVTAAPKVALAIQTADCAPMLLWSPEGVIGVAHAGWRSLAAGIIEHAADAMRALGATAIEAELGPCIHVECYEFGAADLDVLAARYGDAVRGRTSTGRPALDLVAAGRQAAEVAGVDLWVSTVDVGEDCTACNDGKYFSFRARAEPQRMATVIWREDGPGAT